MKAALDRARSGGGPTLVEAMCYRFLSHSTDDDDRTYRDRDAVEEQRKHDPVPRFEALLLERGVVDDGGVAATQGATSCARPTRRPIAAEAMPFPAAADLYTNVYEGAHEPWL